MTRGPRSAPMSLEGAPVPAPFASAALTQGHCDRSCEARHPSRVSRTAGFHRASPRRWKKAWPDVETMLRFTDPFAHATYTLPPVRISREEAFSFALARKLLAHYECPRQGPRPACISRRALCGVHLDAPCDLS